LTLIELMIVVAIIGILASLAVYMFGRTSRKAKASEVRVMFSEFKTRQEAYHVEYGEYASTAADDATFHPAAPAGADTKTSLAPLPASWATLRMAPRESLVHCSYLTRAGAANAACVNCARAVSFGFNANVPTDQWYYLLAQCDWDGKSTNSFYFARSDRDGVAVQNDGK